MVGAKRRAQAKVLAAGLPVTDAVRRDKRPLAFLIGGCTLSPGGRLYNQTGASMAVTYTSHSGQRETRYVPSGASVVLPTWDESNPVIEGAVSRWCYKLRAPLVDQLDIVGVPAFTTARYNLLANASGELLLIEPGRSENEVAKKQIDGFPLSPSPCPNA